MGEGPIQDKENRDTTQTGNILNGGKAEMSSPTRRKNEIVPKFSTTLANTFTSWLPTTPKTQHEVRTQDSIQEHHSTSCKGEQRRNYAAALAQGVEKNVEKELGVMAPTLSNKTHVPPAASKVVAPQESPGFIARMLGWQSPLKPEDEEDGQGEELKWAGHGKSAASSFVHELVDGWTVSANITGASTQSPGSIVGCRSYMVYAILVEITLAGGKGTASFTVSRRFSRFVELHRQLCRDFSDASLPPLPPREPFNSSVNPTGLLPAKD